MKILLVQTRIIWKKECNILFCYVPSPTMKYSLHCILEFARNKTLQFSFLFECKTIHAEKIYFYMRFLQNKRIAESFLILKIPGKKDFQLLKPIFLSDFSSWCVVTRFPGCNNGNSFSVLLKWLSILLFAHFLFLFKWCYQNPFNCNRMSTIEDTYYFVWKLKKIVLI